MPRYGVTTVSRKTPLSVGGYPACRRHLYLVSGYCDCDICTYCRRPPLHARDLQPDMSRTDLTATTRSNYHYIFESALEAYKKKTGEDLASNPLLGRLETSHSPDDVLDILREHIPGFDQPRRNDDRLTKCLNSTVNVLYAFSTTIGGNIGQVSLGNSEFLLSGIHLAGMATYIADLFGHCGPSLRE